MGGFVFLLIVLALIVLGRLGKAAKQSGSTSLSRQPRPSRPARRQQVRDRATLGFQQVQQQVEALRQYQRGQSGQSGLSADSRRAGPSWPEPNIAPALPAGDRTSTTESGPSWGGPPALAAWVTPTRTASPPGTAYDDTTVVPAAGEANPEPTTEAGEGVEGVTGDVRNDPGVRAFFAHLHQPDTSDPTESVLSSSVTDRYVGSAALESTLDSAIESTLFGSAQTSATAAVFAVGSRVELSGSLETSVRELLSAGHEVAAVGLLCDELHCGIIDAMRTVHGLR